MTILSKLIYLPVMCMILASCSGSDESAPGNASNTGVNNTGSGLGVATLSWLPPTENTDSSNLDDLTGYKIHYGEQADNLTETVDINDVNISTYVLENLNENTTYYFAITAVNGQSIESAYSNIVSKTMN